MCVRKAPESACACASPPAHLELELDGRVGLRLLQPVDGEEGKGVGEERAREQPHGPVNTRTAASRGRTESHSVSSSRA